MKREIIIISRETTIVIQRNTSRNFKRTNYFPRPTEQTITHALEVFHWNFRAVSAIRRGCAHLLVFLKRLQTPFRECWKGDARCGGSELRYAATAVRREWTHMGSSGLDVVFPRVESVKTFNETNAIGPDPDLTR